MTGGTAGKASRAAASERETAELADILRQAEAALLRGDAAAGDAAMTTAAGLCRRLDAAGLALPDAARSALREIADRCGREIARLGLELETDSLRDERIRRGLQSYRAR